MASRTIQESAKTMGKIDFAMLTTRTEDRQLVTRPMSNNSEVEWDGEFVPSTAQIALSSQLSAVAEI